METGVTNRAEAKAEAEALMNSLLPFSVQMLEKYGSFHPFGGFTDASGEIRWIAGDTGEEFPAGEHLIEVLKAGLRDGAEREQYRCTAVVFDSRVVPPNETEKSDAIAFDLQHRSGYVVFVYFPYKIRKSRALRQTRNVELGKVFATEGNDDIFVVKQ